MPEPVIALTPAPVANDITDRAEAAGPVAAGVVLARDLSRYYALLHAELDTAAGDLSAEEALLICDAMRGTYLSDQLVEARHLDDDLRDSIALESLAGKWSVDEARLLRTVTGWSVGQRLAVLDAVERFWLGPDGDQMAALHVVGLLPRPPHNAAADDCL